VRLRLRHWEVKLRQAEVVRRTLALGPGQTPGKGISFAGVGVNAMVEPPPLG